jgi:hypothetical protein
LGEYADDRPGARKRETGGPTTIERPKSGRRSREAVTDERVHPNADGTLFRTGPFIAVFDGHPGT